MGKSYFDGGLLQLIGWKILGFLVTFLSLGICYPWAICMIYNWETKHTVINGRRLRFDGKAIQLFGSWIKWWLLTLITFGIYGWWVPIKLKRWITKHSEFADQIAPTLPEASAAQPSANQYVAKAETDAYGALLAIGIAFCAAGLYSVLFVSWWGYAAVGIGVALLFAAGEQ